MGHGKCFRVTDVALKRDPEEEEVQARCGRISKMHLPTQAKSAVTNSLRTHNNNKRDCRSNNRHNHRHRHN